MASRLIPPGKGSRLLSCLLWVGASVCLAAWGMVRLWVPLGGRVPGVLIAALAVILTALAVFCFLRFSVVPRFLSSLGRSRFAFLIGALSFLLGAAFDISYAMPNTDALLLTLPLFRLLCHAGNGLLFAFIVLSLWIAGRELTALGRVNPRQMLILFLALNALTGFYVYSCQTVYTWDTAGYWTVARTLAAQPLNYAHLRGILETTLTLDYNHLLAFPLSLIMRLLGGSRAVFLFSISNLYLLPALWALAALGRKKKGGGLILAALFPMLAYTGLVGFVDVAACALAIWAYVVYTSDAPGVSRGIVTGALLVGTFLLRRYFFFFALSFGVAALIQKLLFSRKDWRDFAALFGSSALCAGFFTYTFLLDKVLGTNYGDLYSAYALGLRSDVFLTCRYFGWVLLLLLALFAVWAIVRGDDRPKLALALVQLIVCYVAFVLVQSHGQQHLLLYLPALAVLSAALLLPTPGPWAALLSCLMTLYCFIPKAQPASIEQIPYPAPIPSFQFYGGHRQDINQLKALADFVDSLSQDEPRTAVVLASSFSFNSETLTNLRPSLNLPEPETQTVIQYHGTVDKRDGFNWYTAYADYLIVGDPVQVHLGEENQQTVALLAHHVLEGTGPGRAYEALPETFALEGSVTVRIYRRVRDWEREDYLSISQALTDRYPDYAQLYQLPDWVQ